MTCSDPKKLGAAALAVALCAVSPPADAQQHVIKLATLAPEGSTWIRVMDELNDDLQKRTDGEVKLKMYPGGVSGDERDVVKKVRIGQLQGGGFTGVGLGEIAPEVRVLDAPWLFRDDAEIDFIHKRFDGRFAATLERAGYVVLGWTNLGRVYVFSKNEILRPEDMRQQKMWVWEGDPIAQAAYKSIGVSPIPLSVVDVMSSLETGLIDAVYGPPMGVVALQWFTRTKHVFSSPVADSTGAILVSKKAYDELSPEQQRALKELSAKHFKQLNELSRKENAEALVTLQKQGLVMSPRPTQEDLRHLEELGRTARRDLAGKLFPRELLDKVEQALAEHRGGRGATRSAAQSGKAQNG